MVKLHHFPYVILSSPKSPSSPILSLTPLPLFRRAPTVSRTSILIPLPPALYAPIPKFLKSTILFDFPFYKFNAEKEGTKAVEEARESA